MYINHPEVQDIKYIVEQLIVSPSPVTSLVMEFALTSSKVKSWQHAFNRQILENITYATEIFSEQGIECVKPNGCFFVFPKIFHDDVKFKPYMLEKFGIEIVSGSDFGKAGREHIRINCASSKERVEKGVMNLIKGIKSFS